MVNVSFSRYENRYVSRTITQDGQLFRKKSDGYYCIYSSVGYSRGVKCWKIKIGNSWSSMWDKIGVVSKIYSSDECRMKQISTDNGIGINGLSVNDTVEIILNFAVYQVYFKVNGEIRRQRDMTKKKYYPCAAIYYRNSSCCVLND